MKKYINLTPEQTYYNSVTLYNPDTPNEDTIAHFKCFYEATEFITSRGYSIVYLIDLPNQQTQKWGIRQWNS